MLYSGIVRRRKVAFWHRGATIRGHKVVSMRRPCMPWAIRMIHFVKVDREDSTDMTAFCAQGRAWFVRRIVWEATR